MSRQTFRCPDDKSFHPRQFPHDKRLIPDRTNLEPAIAAFFGKTDRIISQPPVYRDVWVILHELRGSPNKQALAKGDRCDDPDGAFQRVVLTMTIFNRLPFPDHTPRICQQRQTVWRQRDIMCGAPHENDAKSALQGGKLPGN